MTLLEFPNPANKNAIPDAALQPAPPLLINHELVESLQHLLLRAKTGELTAMAWIGLDQTSDYESGWHALIPEQNVLLLGATELLHSEFKGAVYEQ